MPRNRQDARAATEGESQRLQFFEGFKTEQIKTSGATINTVYGGNRDGAPLLLLCGIPETHVLWRKVAPTLSRDYFIVMTDCVAMETAASRPEAEISSRTQTMAQDQVEVMRHLGFEKFALMGHDRGGRAAHRLALDYPEVLAKLIILDIVPTHLPYQRITQEFATNLLCERLTSANGFDTAGRVRPNFPFGP